MLACEHHGKAIRPPQARDTSQNFGVARLLDACGAKREFVDRGGRQPAGMTLYAEFRSANDGRIRRAASLGRYVAHLRHSGKHRDRMQSDLMFMQIGDDRTQINLNRTEARGVTAQSISQNQWITDHRHATTQHRIMRQRFSHNLWAYARRIAHRERKWFLRNGVHDDRPNGCRRVCTRVRTEPSTLHGSE